jgi:hypothetical protein
LPGENVSASIPDFTPKFPIQEEAMGDAAAEGNFE